MSYNKVLVFCESHLNPLILLAEELILQGLSSKNYTHSLIEHNQELYFETDGFSMIYDLLPKGELFDFCPDYTQGIHSNYVTAYSENIAVSMFQNSAMRMQYQYIPLYIDVAEKDHWLKDISRKSCNTLKSLEKEPSDSLFVGTISHLYNSMLLSDFWEFRDKEILVNIKREIENLPDSKIFAVLGRSHCQDLYHEIITNDSELSKRVNFINLESDYFTEFSWLFMELEFYLFRECIEEFLHSGFKDRLNKIFQDLYYNGAKDRWWEESTHESEFSHYANVVNIKLSLYGEDGTVHPLMIENFINA